MVGASCSRLSRELSAHISHRADRDIRRQQRQRHPTDLAGLRGARLVTAVETEEGRRWAESRVKQLTGGDVVAARFMRQDFFEYRPQFDFVSLRQS